VESIFVQLFQSALDESGLLYDSLFPSQNSSGPKGKKIRRSKKKQPRKRQRKRKSKQKRKRRKN